jgi:hypothetical protein
MALASGPSSAKTWEISVKTNSEGADNLTGDYYKPNLGWLYVERNPGLY